MNIIIITPSRKLYNFKTDLAVWDSEFISELDTLWAGADIDKVLEKEIKIQAQRKCIKYVKIIDLPNPIIEASNILVKSGKPQKLKFETKISILREKSYGTFFIDFINKKIISLNKFNNPTKLDPASIAGNMQVVPNNITTKRLTSYAHLIKESHFCFMGVGFAHSPPAQKFVQVIEKYLANDKKISSSDYKMLSKITSPTARFILNSDKWSVFRGDNPLNTMAVLEITKSLSSHGFLFSNDTFESINAIFKSNPYQTFTGKSMNELKELFAAMDDKVNLSNSLEPVKTTKAKPSKI